MASINQFVSEVAHSLGQPNNEALRANIRSIIMHEYAEAVRRTYENHGFVDSNLQQKFVVELEDIFDGSYNYIPDSISTSKIKRTKNRIPKPVRLINNLPFTSVTTRGYKSPVSIPFVRESRGQFYKQVPGMCNMLAYDYINDYIYILPASPGTILNMIDKIAIEAAFEVPYEIDKIIKAGDPDYDTFDPENEYMLSEDMIGSIKDRMNSRNFFEVTRESNEQDLNSRVK